MWLRDENERGGGTVIVLCGIGSELLEDLLLESKLRLGGWEVVCVVLLRNRISLFVQNDDSANHLNAVAVLIVMMANGKRNTGMVEQQ